MTILFTVNTVLMAALLGFSYVDPIGLMLVAGLIADGLIRVLRPYPGRVAAYRALAVILPLAIWTLDFAVAQVRWGLGWSLELTAGITVMAALSGLALSYLMLPPALPTETQAR